MKHIRFSNYIPENYSILTICNTTKLCKQYINSQIGIEYADYIIYKTSYGDYKVAYNKDTCKLSKHI